MFEIGAHLDELRSWPTDRLLAHHEQLVLEQRRLHLEDLDVLLVLDERGQVDVAKGRDGESARTVREKVETARALESLPAVAAAAHSGMLSHEQLTEAAKLADEASDAEWAHRAPNMTPGDLARKARQLRKPTAEESLAQHQTGEVRKWWNDEHTTLRFNGELHGVMGVVFDETLDKLVNAMKPPPGQPWARREHRTAAALLQMCDAVAVAEKVETPQLAPRPLLVVEVPPEGPVTIAGIPLADELVERLRADARIEPLLLDSSGAPVAVGRISSSLSPKVVRAVLTRDGHCRCGDRDLRYGLHVHHLRPRSWGGTDELSNLATVASVHHPLLIPHGPYALVGNPNQPDGLRMKHISDLSPEEAAQVGLPRPRARPGAA